ncbi:MAG: serine/threonine-protein kinase [Gemmatimonadaceae bacterium]
MNARCPLFAARSPGALGSLRRSGSGERLAPGANALHAASPREPPRGLLLRRRPLRRAHVAALPRALSARTVRRGLHGFAGRGVRSVSARPACPLALRCAPRRQCAVLAYPAPKEGSAAARERSRSERQRDCQHPRESPGGRPAPPDLRKKAGNKQSEGDTTHLTARPKSRTFLRDPPPHGSPLANETYTAAGTEPLIERLRRATIGRYDVYAELGTGGMASVFLALDLALDRKVAIKVMSPAMMNSADNIARFKREARVSASLNHPNIIGIYAVGDDPDLAYFVMKYIEGRALDSVIREGGQQSVPFVQTLISAAGKALHYAHSRGVVHRDVKPANFMLDQDGWLIVTDFGIAKLEDMKGLTMTGSIIGTPYYMSPEQFNGKQVTGAADQYALGIVAYEMLTGKQPYTGDTIVEVMRGHLFDEVPSVSLDRPDVPPALEACLRRMMAKDPADRFPTLEEAVAAFGAAPPTVEAEVRTQIITLAKLGAQQQPRMSVPVSPIPAQRPAKRTPPKRPRPKVAKEDEEEEETTRPSRGRLIVGLLTLAIGVTAATAYLRPELFGGLLDGVLGREAAPVENLVATPPPVDSAAIRDSIANFQRAALAFADSVRTDSLAREDSIARVAAAAEAAARARAAATPPGDAAARPQPAPEPVQEQPAREPAREAARPQPAPAETTRTAAPPPTPPPAEPPAPAGPGTIRIGSRIPGAVLYIGQEVRPIGERGVQTLTFPAGSVTISVRAENCARWDTTFVVAAGQTHTIGFRPVSC